MEIVKFDDCFIKEVVQLWNKSCDKEMPYKKFTEEGFRKKFIENVNFDYEGTFVATESNKVIGFANGICKKEFLPGETHENTPGYLTFVLVNEKYRNKGYGTQLLNTIEKYFEECGKKQIQVIFFNPINLEWYIPDTDTHDHPNAPGVDMDGLGYEFLINRGYEQRTQEVSMYLPLNKFIMSQKILKNMKVLKQKNINIEYYDKEKHYEFNVLFDDLKSEDWRKLINDNLALEEPYPILVASNKGKICGFAGPIKVGKSKRGWFAGIGVDSKYRGMGIGTALFYMLCSSFKKEGADFMSLFTGVKNKAKKIYESAGFKVVKSWAVLRKEIK